MSNKQEQELQQIVQNIIWGYVDQGEKDLSEYAKEIIDLVRSKLTPHSVDGGLLEALKDLRKAIFYDIPDDEIFKKIDQLIARREGSAPQEPKQDDKVILIEPMEKVKYPLVREQSIENGHDCWGKLEWTSEYYVYVKEKRERVFEGNLIAHNGTEVIEVLSDWQLKDKAQYQEKNPDFNYGWTPSTEKDYKNPKEGMEYRMIYKMLKESEPKQPSEGQHELILDIAQKLFYGGYEAVEKEFFISRRGSGGEGAKPDGRETGDN